MRFPGLLHHHPEHRARQVRWVLPAAALLLAATVATLAAVYYVSDRAVGREFFRAHVRITHTGQLLEHGVLIGGGLLLLLVVAIAVWALRHTHRIVRPVHTIHRALDALVAGDLGVRVELHRQDEFREVGESLNRLVDEFAATLSRVHALVDRVAGLTAAPTHGPAERTEGPELRALIAELDRTMDFFRLEPRRTIGEQDQ